MNLEIGKVVKLKSCGPEMTIKEYPFKTIDGVEHSNQVVCEWFSSDEVLKHNTFYVEELEIIF